MEMRNVSDLTPQELHEFQNEVHLTILSAFDSLDGHVSNDQLIMELTIAINSNIKKVYDRYRVAMRTQLSQAMVSYIVDTMTKVDLFTKNKSGDAAVIYRSQYNPPKPTSSDMIPDNHLTGDDPAPFIQPYTPSDQQMAFNFADDMDSYDPQPEKSNTLQFTEFSTNDYDDDDTSDTVYGVFDARVWADAFMESVSKQPELTVSKDYVFSWFANAIMTGYDVAMQREHPEENKPLDEYVFLEYYNNGDDSVSEHESVYNFKFATVDAAKTFIKLNDNGQFKDIAPFYRLYTLSKTRIW